MNKKIRIWIIAACILLFLIAVKLLVQGKIDTVDEFQAYMQSFGVFGPLALTMIQVVQVIVPVLPGYLGCAVGAVAFGPLVGFWCNYIGISVGSLIAYLLAKKYGIDFVLTIFSQKQFDKWTKRIEKSRSYDWFLFIATLLPLFPDDFLCYFSGLIRMKWSKFFWIIILGKPWCILAYSIFFGMFG